MRNVATTALGVFLVLFLAACGDGGDPRPESPPDRTTTTRPTQDPSAGTSTIPELLLDFDSLPATAETVQTVRNEGSASVIVMAATSGSAAVRAVDDPEGGRAVRFPAFREVAKAPRTPSVAVLLASDELAELDPGDRDFSFGASFALDRRSSGSAVDDGNNLLQRGGFEGAQLKIQVDRRVPSCRVAGDRGDVFVEADAPVVPWRWYTVTCERDASQVTLTVTPRGRGETSQAWRSSGPIGSVSLGLTPISIGAKTGPTGEIVSSADQFNGAVDDVFIQVD
jgi:hypothetical protein